MPRTAAAACRACSWRRPGTGRSRRTGAFGAHPPPCCAHNSRANIHVHIIHVPITITCISLVQAHFLIYLVQVSICILDVSSKACKLCSPKWPFASNRGAGCHQSRGGGGGGGEMGGMPWELCTCPRSAGTWAARPLVGTCTPSCSCGDDENFHRVSVFGSSTV